MPLETLPIIDLSELDTDPEAFRAKLRDVMHDVGFFYLAGHGIPAPLTDEILDVSRRFFELSDDEKLAIENVNSPQFRGYTRKGKELTNGETDWREQIDIGVDRDTVEGGANFWRLEGPNLWPDALPEMRGIVTEWNTRLAAVALRLLRELAVSLGAPADSFDEAFLSRPFTMTKIVRYPGESDPEPKQGVGAHRDGGVLTLLLVEPEKGGLQVEHDGEWIDAPSVPGTFVVNIGEMLELATDGYLKATLHRVISPRVGSDRISIPYFYNPALDATMPKLALAEQYRAEAHGLSVDPTNSPILETYGENVLRYRLRAHPNVVEVHHRDLLSPSN